MLYISAQKELLLYEVEFILNRFFGACHEMVALAAAKTRRRKCGGNSKDRRN